MTGGFHTERSLRVKHDGTHAIRNIFSTAKHIGSTHNEMLRARANVYARFQVHKAPHWVRSYLEGVWDTLQAEAYGSSLVFGGYYEGKFYSVHSNREDYYGKHGIEASDYADNGKVTGRGHYWIQTGKLFFQSDI